MYHADDQNGGVGMGEVAEHRSRIGQAPCCSYPGSAESHFEDNVPGFPNAYGTHALTYSNQADEEDASRGPGNENLDSEPATTNIQFEPSVGQVRAEGIRSGHLPEGDGDGEQLQSRGTAEKCTLAFKEELADILACIFAEVQATGRLDIPLADNRPLTEARKATV
jgi:hypothetical protein